MNNLKNIFQNKLAEQKALKKGVDAAAVCESFNKAVLDVFGQDQADNIWAISFRCGVLKIGVTNSVLAQEVQGHWGELVDDEGSVKRLVFEVKVKES